MTTVKKSMARLFSISLTVLMTEVLYTRVFSFFFAPNYVYVIVSLAISGLGIGAYLSFKAHALVEHVKAWTSLAWPLLLGLFLLLSYLFQSAPLLLAVALLQFILLGSASARIYRLAPGRYGLLYAADLLGAGVGALGATASMEALGIMTSVGLLPILGAIGLLETRRPPVLLAGGILGIGLLALSTVLPPPGLHDRVKSMSVFLTERGYQLEATRWKSFGRVDVLKAPDGSRAMFIDGNSGTLMVRYPERMGEHSALETMRKVNPGVTWPLSVLPDLEKDHALVIGSGGGVDVTSLLSLGFSRVTAVEMNPLFIAFTKEYSAFNGALYTSHPQVRLVQDEARHFLLTSDEKYDVIVISMALINSLRGMHTIAMAEDYLFTKEAFDTYLRRLKPGGFLLIVGHNAVELMRILVTSLESLRQHAGSVEAAMQQVAVLSLGGHHPILLIRQGRLTREETLSLERLVHVFSPQGAPPGLSYLPDRSMTHPVVTPEGKTLLVPMYTPGLQHLAHGHVALRQLVEASPSRIDPVTDDRPFLYYFDQGVRPEMLIPLLLGVALLVRFSWRLPAGRGTGFAPFPLIGLSFLVVEMFFIQRVGFLFGQGSLVLSLILTGILFSTGLGSLLTRTWRCRTRILTGSLGTLTGLLAIIVLDDLLFGAVRGTLTTVLVSLLTIAQFGFMGMLFPALLDRVGSRLAPEAIALNSAGSMIAGGVGLLFAVQWGFSSLLFLAAGGYLGAALFGLSSKDLRKDAS
ncbi:methyltransferase domain-containing protein [Spirochaeta thermophila]|uniref:Spermine synthase n=1 Tax=Winmispira thermophila (strain ATCC 49972 / DSM 6192 / RI 19.B1) TaxID=665571 RepID=E0RTR2_WINT6|nr:methyltransferase domain-containing protein [Spirochaeta thermophila]ADN02437.1 hypothetical protein STHERM_c14970 [Spirochaeta thermophila DSM 6192]